jgi:hypothetical protein
MSPRVYIPIDYCIHVLLFWIEFKAISVHHANRLLSESTLILCTFRTALANDPRQSESVGGCCVQCGVGFGVVAGKGTAALLFFGIKSENGLAPSVQCACSLFSGGESYLSK